MKILALIPAYKIMDVAAVQSLLGFQSGVYNKGDKLEIVFVYGFNAAKARTKLLSYAASKKDVDYVINIDSDHIVKASDMYKLIKKLERNNLDMLSAGYLVRSTAGRTYAHGKFRKNGTFRKLNETKKRGLIDCDVLGFGFLLMKHSFVKRMVKKYGEDLFLMDSGNNGTEDVYFCRQCKKEGVRICFDADTMVGHITSVVQI